MSKAYAPSSGLELKNRQDSFRNGQVPKKFSRKLVGIIAGILVAMAIILGLGLGLGLRDKVSIVAYPSESYALVDSYSGSTFFNKFDFFTEADPTNGYVTYVSRDVAQANNLTYIAAAALSSGITPIYIQAGKTANYSGVASVRLQSVKNYTQGLFIIDLVHMPTGCGTWPAFWTTDEPNNPTNGEIDIIEGVNLQTQNIMTLHTSNGCKMSSKNRNATGTLLGLDCSTAGNSAGCSVQDERSTTGNLSFGAGFNSNSGGIYAMDWRDNGIRVWFFPRTNLPAGLTSTLLSSGAVPVMSEWGTPVANFPNSKCDIGGHFRNHKIIFDLTFCGDYAGTPAVWNASSCYDAVKYRVCSDYVHANIGTPAMADVYWAINGVYVYQYPGSGATVVG